jgi:hypothetical protein
MNLFSIAPFHISRKSKFNGKTISDMVIGVFFEFDVPELNG